MVFPVVAHAAEPVPVRLSAITLDRGVKDLKYTSAGEVQTLSIYRKQRSKTFDYVGPRTVSFYRETGGVDAGGNPLREVVAEARLPGSPGQYLLLFTQVSESPEQYKVLAIPDNWSEFKLGTYRFLNLAPFEIALKIDDDIHRIKAQDFTDVAGDFSHGSHQQAVMVSLPNGAEPRRVFEGFIYFTGKQRTLYIVTPKKGRTDGSVNFIAIPQSAPRAKQ